MPLAGSDVGGAGELVVLAHPERDLAGIDGEIASVLGRGAAHAGDELRMRPDGFGGFDPAEEGPGRIGEQDGVVRIGDGHSGVPGRRQGSCRCRGRTAEGRWQRERRGAVPQRRWSIGPARRFPCRTRLGIGEVRSCAARRSRCDGRLGGGCFQGREVGRGPRRRALDEHEGRVILLLQECTKIAIGPPGEIHALGDGDRLLAYVAVQPLAVGRVEADVTPEQDWSFAGRMICCRSSTG